MSGIIVPILKKTEYNYTFLGTDGTSSVVLHTALNAVPYKSARLLVRLHRETMATDQIVNFRIYGTAPSPEDPQEFWNDTALMTVTINGASAAAGDLGTATATDIYPFLKVAFDVEQSTSNTPFHFEISADLLLRED